MALYRIVSVLKTLTSDYSSKNPFSQENIHIFGISSPRSLRRSFVIGVAEVYPSLAEKFTLWWKDACHILFGSEVSIYLELNSKNKMVDPYQFTTTRPLPFDHETTIEYDVRNWEKYIISLNLKFLILYKKM